ncbi:hypothetical protein E2562_023191 [Oryza meyeriana var. granulata]|uniref:Uncharacterized protein n=1 Tax=Oryza meyeriana var. granulata TaxID=110450 RepID=A0A6G1BZV4_9ORYZ|nr:hypothetical protein E2562_023191 [Oryza meyeriana var. granulata]
MSSTTCNASRGSSARRPPPAQLAHLMEERLRGGGRRRSTTPRLLAHFAGCVREARLWRRLAVPPPLRPLDGMERAEAREGEVRGTGKGDCCGKSFSVALVIEERI